MHPPSLKSITGCVGIDGAALANVSRLVAKVDSAAVQDGFDLYLHGFIVADDGKWVVVQQGMNDETKQARRYHWLSEGLESFIDSPHSAIEGRRQGDIINLADKRAERSRDGQLDILKTLGPDRIVREASAIARRIEPIVTSEEMQLTLPHLIMPAHHDAGNGCEHEALAR